MQGVWLKLISMAIVVGLVGCAAKTEVTPEPVVTDDRKVIELECRSADTLGCRHKGNIYPWNAWLDVNGYDAKDYELKEVIHKGNKATVVIKER